MQLRVTSLTYEAKDTLLLELRPASGSSLQPFTADNRSMLICCSGSKTKEILIDL